MNSPKKIEELLELMGELHVFETHIDSEKLYPKGTELSTRRDWDTLAHLSGSKASSVDTGLRWRWVSGLAAAAMILASLIVFLRPDPLAIPENDFVAHKGELHSSVGTISSIASNSTAQPESTREFVQLNVGDVSGNSGYSVGITDLLGDSTYAGHSRAIELRSDTDCYAIVLLRGWDKNCDCRRWFSPSEGDFELKRGRLGPGRELLVEFDMSGLPSDGVSLLIISAEESGDIPWDEDQMSEYLSCLQQVEVENHSQCNAGDNGGLAMGCLSGTGANIHAFDLE